MPWTTEKVAEMFGIDLEAEGGLAQAEMIVAAHNKEEAGVGALKKKLLAAQKKLAGRVDADKIKAAVEAADDEIDLEELGSAAPVVTQVREAMAGQKQLAAQVEKLTQSLAAREQADQQRAVRDYLAPVVGKLVPAADLRGVAVNTLAPFVQKADDGFQVVGKNGKPLVNADGKPFTPEQAVAELKTGEPFGIEGMPSLFVPPGGGQESDRGHYEPTMNGGGSVTSHTKEQAAANVEKFFS